MLENATAQEVVSWAVATFRKSLAISTSFQYGGVVLMDMCARIMPDIHVLTLDTGRLPDETYQMVDIVRQRYGIAVELVKPDPAEVDSMVAHHGRDLFYDGVAQRMLCCNIRKVRPLARRLAEFDAYMVGLRRAQSDIRADVQKVESIGGKTRLSPLADWTDQRVREYIEANHVPVHPLYAKGYTSIGCAPCTRALNPGEEGRVGRWWWETEAQKECGLHFTPDGKVVRTVDVLLQEVLAQPHA